MNVNKYNGIDWALFALIMIHLWLLGNRKRSAFIFGMLACCVGCTFGIMIESIASTAMNAIFFFMHLRAYIKWK